MEKFIIEGGTPLAGTIVPAGNKNAALPALAACLLTREEVVLRNIPRIRDVEAMIELMARQDFYGMHYEGKTYDTGSKLGFLTANLAYALERPDLSGPLRTEIAKLLKDHA